MSTAFTPHDFTEPTGNCLMKQYQTISQLCLANSDERHNQWERSPRSSLLSSLQGNLQYRAGLRRKKLYKSAVDKWPARICVDQILGSSELFFDGMTSDVALTEKHALRQRVPSKHQATLAKGRYPPTPLCVVSGNTVCGTLGRNRKQSFSTDQVA